MTPVSPFCSCGRARLYQKMPIWVMWVRLLLHLPRQELCPTVNFKDVTCFVSYQSRQQTSLWSIGNPCTDSYCVLLLWAARVQLHEINLSMELPTSSSLFFPLCVPSQVKPGSCWEPPDAGGTADAGGTLKSVVELALPFFCSQFPGGIFQLMLPWQGEESTLEKSRVCFFHVS